MKLEELVANKELSQKLKEAGFPQSIYSFYWRSKVVKYKDDDGKEKEKTIIVIGMKGGSIAYSDIATNEICVAPTTTELGKELPMVITLADKKQASFYYQRVEGVWYCEYRNEVIVVSVKANTEADVRALMWLKLKEEGLI